VQLPEKLLRSLEGIAGFYREAFEDVHSRGEQITSIRLNPAKPISQFRNFKISRSNKVQWSEFGYYLEQRPSFTFDPLFHAGCYYVQEASSMFLEQALKQTLDLSRPLKILDLSAAPGGKSTHIQSLISKDSLLVSNDVIRSRATVLKNNIIKWGSDNVIVTNNDPWDFVQLKNYFDAIVVDAPCSGSGLFRRDEEAIGQWSENSVQLCSQRQQRILADVWPALKKDGMLVYCTCSYSREEDEDIIQWLRSEFRVHNYELKIMDDWNIVNSPGGYRFWPDRVKGEGFFIACARKLDGEDDANVKVKVKVKVKEDIGTASKKEMEVVKNWVNSTDHAFVKVNNVVYAVPEELLTGVNVFSGNLHVIYFGTMVGELMRDKLIPAHALAMSPLASGKVERVELDQVQAIAYLQKKELKGLDLSSGWKLVTFENYPLGWINVLANRINNYYPKESRILKDI
jgi:16S rRNA C967 or C1407 C5-methylase (RsmB/RsmF family)/NOL1/NOP2/fmu family ribosome biogenesis protein